MSKHIKIIPLTQIERIAIVQGSGRSLAQVKQAPRGASSSATLGSIAGTVSPLTT